MKMNILSINILFAGMAISMSCHKVSDVHIKRACKIEQMTCFEPGLGDNVTQPRFFSYNEFGDPVKVVFEHTMTGSDSYEFFYDDQHRLIRLFISGTVEDTHNFTYDDTGNIIIDSSVDTYGQESETKFYYDEQKRIIKTLRKFYGQRTPNREDEIAEYNYNSTGNLIREGIVYDDKISIRRTNKIWMFLDRDYSRNNASYGYSETGLPSAYNEYGLPLNRTYFLGYDAKEVIYDCLTLPLNK